MYKDRVQKKSIIKGTDVYHYGSHCSNCGSVMNGVWNTNFRVGDHTTGVGFYLGNWN